jgi:hypothetical protein
MNISDGTLFIIGFVIAIIVATGVIFLARNAGGPRRGQRPGTDFYSEPPPENPGAVSIPNLTDVTPIHGEGHPHSHIGDDSHRR